MVSAPPHPRTTSIAMQPSNDVEPVIALTPAPSLFPDVEEPSSIRRVERPNVAATPDDWWRELREVIDVLRDPRYGDASRIDLTPRQRTMLRRLRILRAVAIVVAVMVLVGGGIAITRGR
jgi:hypothetical protein